MPDDPGNWDDSNEIIPSWEDQWAPSTPSLPRRDLPNFGITSPVPTTKPFAKEITSLLQSNSVYRVVDLIGLGEIEGLVNGEESIYLNETPLKDGAEYNFDDVVVVERKGTSDQTFVPDFNTVENTIAVNEELKYDPGNPEYSTTKVISDTDVDRVRLTMTLSTLFWFTDDGDYKATECDIRVDVRPDGGAWTTIIGEGGGFYFKGLSKGQYQRSVEIDLVNDVGGSHPYDIRCYRMTLDSEDSSQRNSVSYWTDYTEIINVKLTYPHCALIGSMFNARGTGGNIPSRIYHIRGRKIEVPNNYTPYLAATYVDADTFTVVGDQTAIFAAGADFCCNCGDDGYMQCEVLNSSYSSVTTVNLTVGSDSLTSNLVSAERVYTGTWNGTFQTLWTSNNAWVFYDIVTNNLIGCSVAAEYVDKWTLYTIGQYCDQLVDDGYGNKQPRYQFNGIIKSQFDAVSLFSIIAKTFRAICYQGPSVITASQDKPGTATRTFNNANVIKGIFHYEGTGIKEIYTTALVTYNNPNDFGRGVPEYVDNTWGLHRYGYNQIGLKPRGVNNRGEAHRHGKWILETSVAKPDKVKFSTSFDSVDLVPGEIVKIADQFYGDKRFGFRIVTASGTTVDVEGAFVKEGGETYTIFITIRDADDKAELESRTVSGASDLGNGNTRLTISSGFTDDPSGNEICVIAQADDSEENVREFRVITADEVEPNIYDVFGIEHDNDKYDRVEGDLEFEVENIASPMPPYLSPPTSIEVVEFTYVEGQNHLFGLNVYWKLSTDPRVESYIVQYEKYSTLSGEPLDYFTVGRVNEPFFQIKPIDISGSGTIKYKVRVRAMSRITKSAWVESSEITIIANPDAPSDVTNLQVKGGGTVYTGVDCLIEWDDMVGSTNARLKDYRIRIYRTDDTLLSTEYSKVPYFTYSFEQNKEDNYLEDSGDPVTSIKFLVDCRNIYDKFSTTPTSLTATVVGLSTPTNLSVQGGGSVFTGKDCYIVWDDMYSGSDRLVDYRIRIRRTDDTLLSTVYTVDPWFNYSFEQNKEDNYIEDGGSPQYSIKFQVECRNGFGNLSATPATLTATNPVPGDVQNVAASGRMGGVDFTWTANWESDFSHFKYRILVEGFSYSSYYVINGIRVQRTLTTGEKSTSGFDANITIEVFAVDVFGQESAIAGTHNADCLGLAVDISDISDYSLTANKFDIPLPLVDGLTITNDDPIAGSVSWTAFNLYLNGTLYEVISGDSANEFICFKDLSTTLVEIDTHPSEEYANWDPEEDFMIIWNNGGIGKKAWSTFINLVASSAFIGALAVVEANIGDGAITNAKINDLNATKIDAGYLAAARIEAGSILVGKMFDGFTESYGNIVADPTFALTDAVDNYNYHSLTDSWTWNEAYGESGRGIGFIEDSMNVAYNIFRDGDGEEKYIPVSKNEKIFIQIRAKTDAGYNGYLRASLRQYDKDKNNLGDITSSNLSLTTSWATHSVQLVPTNNACHFISLRLYASGGFTSSAYVYVDSVHAQIEPEANFRHASDFTLIDGGSIYTNSILVAGLNSDATDRMFTGSTIKTNIEAWVHTSDATLIDGGSIYANSITLSKMPEYFPDSYGPMVVDPDFALSISPATPTDFHSLQGAWTFGATSGENGPGITCLQDGTSDSTLFLDGNGGDKYIPITPNDKIIYQVRAKRDSDFDGYFVIVMSEYDENQAYIEYTSATIVLTTSWATYTKQLTPANASCHFVRFGFNSNGGTPTYGTCSVDSVNITKEIYSNFRHASDVTLIDGGSIYANSITLGKLPEYFPESYGYGSITLDPTFALTKNATDYTYQWPVWNCTWGAAYGESGPGVRFDGADMAMGTIYFYDSAGEYKYSPARKGDKVFIEVRVKTTSAFDGTLTIATPEYDEAKVVGTGHATSMLPSVDDSWQTVTIQITLVDNDCHFVRLSIYSESATTGYAYIDSIQARIEPSANFRHASDYTKIDGGDIHASSSIAIGPATTWQSDGIQLDYNAGNPRFYVGDGSNNYLQFDGTNLELSTSKADAIVIKNGGNILLELGGDLVLQADDSNPASIYFKDSGGGSAHIELKRMATDNKIRFQPVNDKSCELEFGTTGNEWWNIASIAYVNQSHWAYYDSTHYVSIDIDAGSGNTDNRWKITTNNDGTLRKIDFAGANFGPATGYDEVITLGLSTLAWSDAYASDWGAPADFYHFDKIRVDGIDVKIDDTAIIKSIQKSGKIDQLTGFYLIDDDTLPKWLLKKDKETGKISESSDGRPYLSLKTMISLCMGAIRQLDNKIEELKT